MNEAFGEIKRNLGYTKDGKLRTTKKKYIHFNLELFLARNLLIKKNNEFEPIKLYSHWYHTNEFERIKGEFIVVTDFDKIKGYGVKSNKIKHLIKVVRKEFNNLIILSLKKEIPRVFLKSSWGKVIFMKKQEMEKEDGEFLKGMCEKIIILGKEYQYEEKNKIDLIKEFLKLGEKKKLYSYGKIRRIDLRRWWDSNGKMFESQTSGFIRRKEFLDYLLGRDREEEWKEWESRINEKNWKRWMYPISAHNTDFDKWLKNRIEDNLSLPKYNWYGLEKEVRDRIWECVKGDRIVKHIVSDPKYNPHYKKVFYSLKKIFRNKRFWLAPLKIAELYDGIEMIRGRFQRVGGSLLYHITLRVSEEEIKDKSLLFYARGDEYRILKENNLFFCRLSHIKRIEFPSDFYLKIMELLRMMRDIRLIK